ncbi:MAG: DNA polymerase III subunit gamma/tau, partial [Candidatus Nitrotoga sp.]
VDNMRELLEGALYLPTSGRFKVYIIDEVHMLSKAAFNAMLKTLEEPPTHVKFILATTDPQKIPVTVLSRCLQFNLKQLPAPMILTHLQYVLGRENIPFESAACALIARAAQGSMRDALSLLDQAIAYSDSQVDEEVVRNMLGAIDQQYLYDLLRALLARDGVGLLAVADNMTSRSLPFDVALQDFATLLHRIALIQTVPAAMAEEETEREILQDLAQRFSAEEIQLYYQIAIHGRNEIELAPDEYAGFTMTLLRMLAFMPVTTGAVVSPPVHSAPVAAPKAAMSKPPAQQLAHSAQVNQPASKMENQPLSVSADVAVEHSASGMDWSALLGQINVQGMARELARHCTMESFMGGKLSLNLSPQHKHLLANKAAHEKLQATLAEYLAQPVRLQVVLSKGNDAITPAAAEKNMQDMRQQQAVESIMQDVFVLDAQVQLGAQVLTESLKPV